MDFVMFGALCLGPPGQTLKGRHHEVKTQSMFEEWSFTSTLVKGLIFHFDDKLLFNFPLHSCEGLMTYNHAGWINLVSVRLGA